MNDCLILRLGMITLSCRGFPLLINPGAGSTSSTSSSAILSPTPFSLTLTRAPKIQEDEGVFYPGA